MAKDHFWLILGILTILLFFSSFISKRLLPISADTIVGMYHPFRDAYVEDYPRGYPFKNFLITDPVRQQYPWKRLIVNQWSQGKIPWWNPYSFAGAPLLANFQSGAFYPLNVLFFLFSFKTAWAIYISIQPILALIFMYLFLKTYNLSSLSSVIGGLAFAFSGFMTAWFEWGNIGHTALWLPLILLLIERLVDNKRKAKVIILLIFTYLASFFAGHLQTFFYLFVFSLFYFVTLVLNKQVGKSEKKNIIKSYAFAILLFSILSIGQWWPTVQFIKLSNRLNDIPQVLFLPFKQLIQFIIPDFFGNPVTMNYWGEWNYGEYASYIGIVPVFLALYFILTSKLKTMIFFKSAFVISLLLAVKNPISQIPFALKAPFISTASPARLLFISCFSLSILSAFGLDKLFKEKKRKLFLSLLGWISLLAFFWLSVLLMPGFINADWTKNLLIAKRNLIFPTAIFSIFSLIIFFFFNIALSFNKFKKTAFKVLSLLIFLIILIDILRFFKKFNPFVKSEFIFPQTKITAFLQEQERPFRILAIDDRILPPNFSSVYGLETIQGYDPLILKSYADYIGSFEETRVFNRQVNPKKINNDLINRLNVKYILSFDNLTEPQFEKVMEEGKTKLYLNKKSYPRAFFDSCHGKAKITDYTDGLINIEADSPGQCLLVISQVFYPGWEVKIDNTQAELITNSDVFPSIWLPEGKHNVTLYFSQVYWPKIR